MRDHVTTATKAPIGYFVHHQGRGHAERFVSIAKALPEDRPLAVFCARPEILTGLPKRVEVIEIPSLFEPSGNEPRGMGAIGTPDTLHCAPVGWPGIRAAMAQMAAWFESAAPALMISDVSAEVAQLARICSVPHVKVLQHGTRSDPGHMAAYDGAAGLLAPFDEALAQEDWTPAMRANTFFAGGLGLATRKAQRAAARRKLGLDPDRHVVLVLSGGGGRGTPDAPLTLGARALPDSQWITVGRIATDWHATPCINLKHAGWVDGVEDHIAAADLVVSSAGNTTCTQVLRAGKPWIVVPEWRYFDEQLRKAQALAKAGVALHLQDFPASVQAWRAAAAEAEARHDPALQGSLVRADAAEATADWLEALIARLWSFEPTNQMKKEVNHV